MAKEFDSFMKQYDGFMKWSVKQANKVMEDQENFDTDELYGMYTTMMKKAMDLSNSAMELVEWQCKTLETLQLAEERRAKDAYEMKNVLVLINDKLESLKKKEKENK